MKKIFLVLIICGFSLTAMGLTPEKAISSLLDSAGRLGQADIVFALTHKFKWENLNSGLVSYINSHDETKGSLLAAELLTRSTYSDSGAMGLFNLVMSPVGYLSKNATEKMVNILNSRGASDVRIVRGLSLSQKTDLVEKMLQWTPKMEQREYSNAILKIGSPAEIASIVQTNFQVTNLDGLNILEKMRSESRESSILSQCKLFLGQFF